MQFDSVACSIVVLLFIIDDVDTNSDDVWKTVQFIVINHAANIITTLLTFYTVVISIFRKVLQYAFIFTYRIIKLQLEIEFGPDFGP